MGDTLHCYWEENGPVSDEAVQEMLDSVRQATNAVPVVRMGGLWPAYYITDDPTEADAWLIEVKPKEL